MQFCTIPDYSCFKNSLMVKYEVLGKEIGFEVYEISIKMSTLVILIHELFLVYITKMGTSFKIVILPELVIGFDRNYS
jgi:hypothetical protein